MNIPEATQGIVAGKVAIGIAGRGLPRGTMHIQMTVNFLAAVFARTGNARDLSL
jgi:hypothetical protein